MSCQTRKARAAVALFVVLLAVLSPVSTLAQTTMERGTEAFLYNRPQEAASLFELALEESPTSPRAYLYLALSYEQLKMHDRAIAVLERSLTVPGVDRSLVRFNIGNNQFSLGNIEAAVASYTQAIEANGLSVAAYLNRANGRVRLETYDGAISDYTRVLALAPEHPQRSQIEAMIALLRDDLEQQRIAAEQARIAAEEAERQREAAEQQRIAEEQRRQDEAEARRRALLNNVLGSLKTATEDTQNISAGNEDIDDYDDESIDIAD